MTIKGCVVVAVFISAALDVSVAANPAAVDCAQSGEASADHYKLPNNLPMPDALGSSTTFSVAGGIDLRNPFFKDLGTNGRTCGSCHEINAGWTISAADTRRLFDVTRGTAPIFRTVDGSNSPDADVSTLGNRRAAYSMLLSRGTIRVGIGVPEGADFALTAVDDPYGFASAAQLSLFRRPLPATNLAFDSAVMWDGRITGDSLQAALGTQANGATLGHAQGATPLDETTQDAIVAFETGLFTTQFFDRGVGSLSVNGGHGDPEDLAGQTDRRRAMGPVRRVREQLRPELSGALSRTGALQYAASLGWKGHLPRVPLAVERREQRQGHVLQHRDLGRHAAGGGPAALHVHGDQHGQRRHSPRTLGAR